MGEITRRNEVPCDSLQAALSPPAPQTGAFLVPPQTNQTKPSGLPEAHARPLPRVYLQKWPAFPSVQWISRRVGQRGKKGPFVWRTCESIPSEACNFPYRAPWPWGQQVPEGAAIHTQPAFTRQFSVVPREVCLNGFTMCKLFQRVAGRLLSAARIRAETNPRDSHSCWGDSACTLRGGAFTPGIEKHAGTWWDLAGPGNECVTVVSPWLLPWRTNLGLHSSVKIVATIQSLRVPRWVPGDKSHRHCCDVTVNCQVSLAFRVVTP